MVNRQTDCVDNNARKGTAVRCVSGHKTFNAAQKEAQRSDYGEIGKEREVDDEEKERKGKDREIEQALHY